jgi:myo-inositol-1(or 4)-monophosphatase
MTAAAEPNESAGSTGAFVPELEFAVTYAQRAGDLLLARYRRVGPISAKSPRDVVTEVDHLSEALLIDAIRATFPGDHILAEESGAHRPVGAGGDPAGRTWVLDPLDGTINYANGIPFFCVSVALVAGGRPVVGVVVDPVRSETFAAATGGPATLDGQAITASGKADLGDFVLSLSLGGPRLATRVRAIRRATRAARSMGAAALALAYVANGRVDAFVQQGGLSIWDFAAAGLIAECAGAAVTDLAGGPWFDLAGSPNSFGLLAAPTRHHATLVDLAR